MADLVHRSRTPSRPEGCLHVFTTKDGNPYFDSGFLSTRQRAMGQAIKAKVVACRFTFHDLRAYYTTQHKAQYQSLPELHFDAKTTAKVYDRSRVSVHKGLDSIPMVGIKQKSRYNFNSCSGLYSLVGRAGVEPTTNGLKVRCSTN